MTGLKLRLFFAIGIAFVIAVFWVQRLENRAIDRCLDAGLRWSYDEGACAE